MKEVWVCRCGLVDVSKCEKRKRISNYFACQEITQTELGGNFSSSICDAKKFVEEKVGKWIHQEYSPMPDERMYYNGEMWRCSCCENIKAFKSDYCPNCGARMTDDNKLKE